MPHPQRQPKEAGAGLPRPIPPIPADDGAADPPSPRTTGSDRAPRRARLGYFVRGTLGAAGSAGALGVAGCVCSMIERGARWVPAMMASPMLVAKKAAARIAVVRVSRLWVERPVMKPDMPPPPLMPSPPPSLFWIRMTPIIAMARRRWMTRTMVVISENRPAVLE